MQSFIDPHKFPIETLLKRIQVMITTMLNHLGEAISKEKYDVLNDINTLEEKIDQLYFLCIRQIFVRIKMGILGDEAPHAYIHAIGDRVVVLTLEEITDSIQTAANEALKLKEHEIKEDVKNTIVKLHETTQIIFGKTMKGFFSLDVSLSNDVIESTRRFLTQDIKNAEEIIDEIENPRLAVSLRSIIWNLVNIVRNCKIIAEVTINRFVRTPSKLITIEIF